MNFHLFNNKRDSGYARTIIVFHTSLSIPRNRGQVQENSAIKKSHLMTRYINIES